MLQITVHDHYSVAAGGLHGAERGEDLAFFAVNLDIRERERIHGSGTRLLTLGASPLSMASYAAAFCDVETDS